MFFQNWILPILIGIISAVLLVAILFNDKQKFSDLGAVIQLDTSSSHQNYNANSNSNVNVISSMLIS